MAINIIINIIYKELSINILYLTNDIIMSILKIILKIKKILLLLIKDSITLYMFLLIDKYLNKININNNI